MKKTHLSLGIYDQTWKRTLVGGRIREKHRTACGTICDLTKATTERTRVTCKMCLKRVGQ